MSMLAAWSWPQIIIVAVLALRPFAVAYERGAQMCGPAALWSIAFALVLGWGGFWN
jgi:hypothetical protein